MTAKRTFAPRVGSYRPTVCKYCNQLLQGDHEAQQHEKECTITPYRLAGEDQVFTNESPPAYQQKAEPHNDLVIRRLTDARWTYCSDFQICTDTFPLFLHDTCNQHTYEKLEERRLRHARSIDTENEMYIFAIYDTHSKLIKDACALPDEKAFMQHLRLLKETAQYRLLRYAIACFPWRITLDISDEL